MMRFSPFVSFWLALFICSCNPHPYRDLRREDRLAIGTEDLKPEFERGLYRCAVDGKFLWKSFHLSGILYLKNFSDTAIRVVFQGEMGNTFFDFGWDRNDSFTVYTILPQMNRPPLIRTLRKDFELLLAKGNSGGSAVYKDETGNTLLRYELEDERHPRRGYAYYIINRDGRLARVENADDRRRIVIMEMTPPAVLKTLPDTILVRHPRAGFTIDMKKIQPYAE